MATNYRKPSSRFTIPASCKVINGIHTRSGLAVTPADMLDLTSRGIAVSSANNLEFNEGLDNPSSVLPVDQLRGVDASDVWNAEMDARSKLVRAHKKDVQLYGE